MRNQIDHWCKLARYDTNIQAELHAKLLRNNGTNVSLQALSGLPRMRLGAVIWDQHYELRRAQQVLDSIDSGGDE